MKEKYTTSVLRTPTGSVARRNKLLLLLTCAAGYVDAVSYLQLGHVFTANMTGNTVLLGLSLIERNAPAAVRSGLAVGGFLAGAASGSWIVKRNEENSVWPSSVTQALALEAALLLLLAIDWSVIPIAPLAEPVLHVVNCALSVGDGRSERRSAPVRGIGYCDDLHHRNSHQSNDPHREFAAA